VRIVPPFGPVSSPSLMVVGEAPGRNEAEHSPPRPLVGKSGQLLERFLNRSNLSLRGARLSNVIQEYTEGNPDPTPEQIEYWTPKLVSDIHTCRPKVILALGRFATRWFLGERADLETCYGMPYSPGTYDWTRKNRAPSRAIIIPCHHTAGTFYSDPERAARTMGMIGYAIDKTAYILSLLSRGIQPETVCDPFRGCEEYVDLTGREMEDILLHHRFERIAIDTEGTPSSPWSWQASISPGQSYILRVSQADFSRGSQALQRVVDSNRVEIITHDAATPVGCMYETMMLRAMGCELTPTTKRSPPTFNTMYALYVLNEVKSLKASSERYLGKEMVDYSDTIASALDPEQLDYLFRVTSLPLSLLPQPDPYKLKLGDLTEKTKKPKSLQSLCEGIIRDWEKGRLDKDGNPTNFLKRWTNMSSVPGLKEEAERTLGYPFPVPSFDTIPLDKAIFYAGGDSDATLRLRDTLPVELERLGISSLMSHASQWLPLVELMQRTGMEASRSSLLALVERAEREGDEYTRRLAEIYGEPINPRSRQQVASLLRRQGIRSPKRTKAGDASTAKKAIEQFRYDNESIEVMFSARERYHTRDSFGLPLLACMPSIEQEPARKTTQEPSRDIFTVHSTFNPVSVASRRLASTDPNLLNVPPEARHSFMCEPPRVYMSWDYGQIEIFVAWFVSQDPTLGEIVRNPKLSMHTETAAYIFGVPVSSVTPEQKKAGKITNFQVMYGGNGHSVWLKLCGDGITAFSEADCKGFVDGFFRKYSGIKRKKDEVANLVYNHPRAEMRTLGGMGKRFPGIWSEDRETRDAAAREAFSLLVQGTAQEMIQCSLCYLYPRVLSLAEETGEDIRLHLDLHDELVASASDYMWPAMNEMVRDAMLNHSGLDIGIPLKCDGRAGQTWGELKD
jgi:uracil-DNA glycosylase family 4